VYLFFLQSLAQSHASCNSYTQTFPIVKFSFHCMGPPAGDSGRYSEQRSICSAGSFILVGCRRLDGIVVEIASSGSTYVTIGQSRRRGPARRSIYVQRSLMIMVFYQCHTSAVQYFTSQPLTPSHLLSPLFLVFLIFSFMDGSVR